MNEKHLEFSPIAKEELKQVVNALSEIMDITTEAFTEDDIEKAKRVEPLEQVIDILISEAKNKHIERLQKGECTIELGFMLTEVLNNIERVSDHCSNIAACMIQINQSSFDRHQYLNNIKSTGEEAFEKLFEEYKAKYITNSQA